MADTTVSNYLTSYEQIQANYEKYADRFTDANAELVNSETFLNLLVAEMTNQDPLEPTSNTEFVTQMAQFTSLQYAQDSSKYALANYASSIVGKTVTASMMEGSEYVTETGVVDSVIKNGDTYTVSINGKTFDISKITAVEKTVTKTETETDVDKPAVSDTLSLGDTIAKASLMIGMHATVNATTNSGSVIDAGVVDSIQVKNGEINVVIGDIAYKLTDVIEVRYPDYEESTDSVTDVESATGTGGEAIGDAADDEVTEIEEELVEDATQDEDIEDLEDLTDETEEA